MSDAATVIKAYMNYARTHNFYLAPELREMHDVANAVNATRSLRDFEQDLAPALKKRFATLEVEISDMCIEQMFTRATRCFSQCCREAQCHSEVALARALRARAGLSQNCSRGWLRTINESSMY